MINSGDYPPHRPELYDSLRLGDVALLRAMSGKLATFAAGRQIKVTGDRGNLVYRVRTGWLARTRNLSDGRRQIVTICLPGDLAGVESLFLARQPDSIECLSQVTVNVIDVPALRQLVESNAAVAWRVMYQLVQNELRLYDSVTGLGRGSAEERIAFMLLDFHKRLHRVELCPRDTFGFPMSQQEIGDYLGLTVVHVNRMLRRLREAGSATVRNGVVVIHDISGLRDMASPFLVASPSAREDVDTKDSEQAAQ
jgi:CRP/FNR family transcriptional regulator